MESQNSFGEAIQVLKLDVMDFERASRQILSELAMKRVQVEELKKELEAAGKKILECSREKERITNEKEQLEHNLNLATKNAGFYEDQLQTKCNSMSKAFLQHTSSVAEKENLRELLENSQMQNLNLTHENTELKIQRNCDAIYQTELGKQTPRIQAKIKKIEEGIEKCRSHHAEILALSNKMDLAEEALKTAIIYRQKWQLSEEKCEELEQMYILANAKVETFQNLIEKNEGLFTFNPNGDVVFTLWEHATYWFNEQIQIYKKLKEESDEKLKKEYETNLKLVHCEAAASVQNEELKKRIETLESENAALREKLESTN